MTSTPRTSRDRLWIFTGGVFLGLSLGYLSTKAVSFFNSKEKGSSYRRIITGHDQDGKSDVILVDSIPNRLEPSNRNVKVYNVWRSILDIENKIGMKIKDPFWLSLVYAQNIVV